MLPVKPDKFTDVGVIYNHLEYFSASGIAKLNLSGVPKSRIGIYKLADRECWQFILVDGKGRKDGVKHYRVPDYIHLLIIDAREAYKYISGDINDENRKLNQDSKPYESQAVELRETVDVNMALLEVAVLVVHRYYASEGVVVAPERMAKLIVAIYKYAAAKGSATPEELDQFLNLIV